MGQPQPPQPPEGQQGQQSYPGARYGPPGSPPPQQPGWPQQPYGQGPRRPWSGRRIAAFAVFGMAALLITLIVVAGVTQGSGTGSTAAAPSAAPTASALAAPPIATASPPPCTTHACIVSDLEQSLVGLVAKDESVITKATCYKSTVVDNAGNTYTAQCHVTYSDDTVYSGYATLLVNSDQVSWEPTEELQ
jgi:hypothetical protein